MISRICLLRAALLVVTSTLLLGGQASAQLVQRDGKTQGKSNSSLMKSADDHSAMVIDFTAELKATTVAPADNKPKASAPNDGKLQPMAGQFCTTGDPAIDVVIRKEAREHNVPPCLVMLVMGAESSFKRTAMSNKGAMGLMQLVPDTAARFGVKNIFNAEENIHGGTAYLRWLLDYFRNDVRLALAGYNAGEGAVVKYHYSVPPYDETQRYVNLIFGQYQRILAVRPAPSNSAKEAPLTYKIMVDFDALREGPQAAKTAPAASAPK